MPGKVPMTYETDPMFRKAVASIGSEVRSVKSDVDFLTDRLMDLGMSVDGLVAISPEPGDGGGFDNDIPQSASYSVDGDERAFEVSGVEFDSSGNPVSPISEWTVYVPTGCVQIDGVAVKFDDEVSEDRVSVSPDVRGGVTLHCVVWKDKDGKAHAKICEGDDKRDALVDKIGGDGGTLYASVPFCTLSDTYEDNNQIHLGVIALTSSGGGGKPKVDEVSTDFMQAVDDDGSPVTEKEEVDGEQKDVPVKTEVIEIKGWHEDDPVGDSTLAELMGLPVKAGSGSQDVIVRDGLKGGTLKYYRLGEVDKEALATGDPCRVTSIGTPTVYSDGVPGMPAGYKQLPYNPQFPASSTCIRVPYYKTGDCSGSGAEFSFSLPIIVPDGQSGTGDVTVHGTDGTNATGSVLRIASDSETNLTCTVSQGQNGEVVLTFGVRYM